MTKKKAPKWLKDIEKKTKTVKAWADVGAHGGIYQFEAGPVASRYPKLMHIYAEKAPGLVPVTITYSI